MNLRNYLNHIRFHVQCQRGFLKKIYEFTRNICRRRPTHCPQGYSTTTKKEQHNRHPFNWFIFVCFLQVALAFFFQSLPL